ncbi:hypothetical protein GOP47_0004337 [Adiantum capillus-veneris]|uniref:ABC1 atypical kinase-like domain-containing protein n=1 Tax=Adiantum capillus-veneris TaxID=13818 RepID=A0A9D4V7W9_ADICA|nr:hypothetical protein GOP47_0004337 [Adiantum capillus-veneris]
MVFKHQHDQQLGHRAATAAALRPALRHQLPITDWTGQVNLEDKIPARPHSCESSPHVIASKPQKSLDRTMQFWSRAIPIYASYKICQLRSQFISKETQEQVWENQHEWAAEKVYSLCSELGGFFLKIAQLVGKPDLAPQAWVRKLVTLCDSAPATPFPVVKCVLEHELGSTMEDLFEEFQSNPIGSASVAQVHRARIKGAKKDVAVKVNS